MALLNYTGSYSNISSYINATTGTVDWLKIFVSPDTAGGGHFITHGIDFGATYAAGQRGLVPGNSAADLTKTFLRGDGWLALWTAAAEAASAVGSTDAQKLAAKEAYLQSTLASVYDIKQWIATSFAANDAMRFKGTITVDSSDVITRHDTTGTSVSGFPTSCEIGDTYKVTGTTNKTLANLNVNSGDMLICIKDGSGSSINTSEYWTVVQNNIENLITYTLNGTAFYLYSSGASNITLFAPTTSGNSGQVLISSGANAAPTWKNQAILVVGEAGKVTNALSKGSGLSFKALNIEVSSYDGSAAVTIAILPATTSNIGGVIIDAGNNSEKYNAVANTSHTLYPTISVKNTGEIYLTKTNIVNALGYDPISAIPVFTATDDGLAPAASAANKSATPAIATTYLLGADAKWYQLPASAFQSDRRIVQLAGTTVIAADSGNALNVIAGTHINVTAEKVSNAYTGKMTFDAIWRDIQVHLISGSSIGLNVASIGDDDPLVFDNSESVFMLGEQVTVGSGANATQKTVIKSYVTWYNMDTGEYEIV